MTDPKLFSDTAEEFTRQADAALATITDPSERQAYMLKVILECATRYLHASEDPKAAYAELIDAIIEDNVAEALTEYTN